MSQSPTPLQCLSNPYPHCLEYQNHGCFLRPLTESDPAEGRQCQGWMLAGAGKDAAIGESGGCMTPGDIAGGGRASPLGPFPLQLGSWKPPGPGAEQSHSPRNGENSTGGLPLRGIWGKAGEEGLEQLHDLCPAALQPWFRWQHEGLGCQKRGKQGEVASGERLSSSEVLARKMLSPQVREKT